jgi:hypothetical protein
MLCGLAGREQKREPMTTNDDKKVEELIGALPYPPARRFDRLQDVAEIN